MSNRKTPNSYSIYEKSKVTLSKVYRSYPKTVKIACIMLFALLVGFATSLIFVSRAGAVETDNWPVSWDLANSDNGVLYQLSDDIYSGRSLDWSFSPQVYIFPEIPISIVSYGLAGSNVYLYYLYVAIINNIVFFVSIFLLLKFLYPARRLAQNLFHASLAVLPLILLPLITANTLFAYHLAPTYYMGSYLLILAMPYILFGKHRLTRLLIASAFVVTAASNPMLLAFCLPATVVLFIILYFKNGLGSLVRPTLCLIGLLAVSVIIRTILFESLVGTSPTNYVSVELFSKRLDGLVDFSESMFVGNRNRFTFFVSFISIAISIVNALGFSRKYLQSKVGSDQTTLVSLVYLNLVPVTVFVALYLTATINTLYLWPVFVAPIVFVLISLPPKLIKPALLSLLTLLFVALLRPHSIQGIANADEAYFNHRSQVTVCLDQKLPENHRVGYATFSDSRSVSLTSTRDILLIQALPLANPSYWLTNQRYSADFPGTFFVINEKGDELPIRKSVVESNFGSADKTFHCNENIEVLLYENQPALHKIDEYYQEAYDTQNEAN